MALHVDENILQFEYNEDENIYDKNRFFAEEGSEKFIDTSKKQMLLMLQTITDELNITDEYGIKKVEVMLKSELPFFAVNRRIIKNWILQNFIY